MGKKLKIGGGCLTIVVVVAVVSQVYLVLSNHLELLAGVWIGVGIGGAVAWVLSGLWSGLLLKSGAEIGARRAESEADKDVARMGVIGEMWKAFRQQAKNEPQAPMLQQQQQRWLPEWPVDGEFSELPEPTIAQRLQKRLNYTEGRDK